MNFQRRNFFLVHLVFIVSHAIFAVVFVICSVPDFCFILHLHHRISSILLSLDPTNAVDLLVCPFHIHYIFITGESSGRTPHALQWAVRNAHRRDTASEPTTHVYVGTSTIRRNAAGASASADLNSSGNALYCMPSALARTFGLVVKEVLNLKRVLWIVLVSISSGNGSFL